MDIYDKTILESLLLKHGLTVLMDELAEITQDRIDHGSRFNPLLLNHWAKQVKILRELIPELAKKG